jgi:subtilisin-like proprotein convertase family protein
MRTRFLFLSLSLALLLLGVWLVPGFAQKGSKQSGSKKSASEKVNVKNSKNSTKKPIQLKQAQEQVEPVVRPKQGTRSDKSELKPVSVRARHFVKTPPLRSLPVRNFKGEYKDALGGTQKPPIKTVVNYELPKGFEGPAVKADADAAILKTNTAAPSFIPSPSVTFDGMNNNDNAAVLGTVVAPPDTIGDVGPNHYVQAINLTVEVFDKSGASAGGPFALTDFWASVPGPCSAFNSGDPIVLYDQLADRWLIAQFALPAGPPTSQCIAISQTGDPLGAYFAYDFPMPNDKLNDYPHFGVWPDAYYMTDNQFNYPVVTTFLGAGVFAFDREKMLAGDPTASFIYFDLADLDPNLGGQLPADLDGLNSVPPGTPGFFFQFEADEFGNPADQMRIWEFHADFATPSNSTFTERADSPIPVAAFDPTLNETGFFPPPGCAGFNSRDDIPQPNPAASEPCARLDAISDRLMHRVQYRNFGTYGSFIAAHTVDVNPLEPDYQAATRVYDFRLQGGTMTVNRQFTIAPDEHHRFMGSAAQDASGNIAVGYSVSSLTLRPSVWYSAVDANMTYLGEGIIQVGGGFQTFSGSRWGDYSSLNVDPLDDCTFWYTQQYYTVDQPELCLPFPAPITACWDTKVGAFPLAPGSCTTPETGNINGTVTNAETLAGVPGARIVATHSVTGAVYEANTDASGHYSRDIPPGDYTLVAKANNYEDSAPVNITLPAGGSVTTDFVLVPKGVLALDSVTVDDSAGNNDGEADPNECVNLTITLINVGPGTATGISGTLVSNTSGVTIPAASATQSYPDAAPGATTSNASPFQASISPVFVCGGDINLTLNVTSDDGPFTIPVTLPTSQAEVSQAFSSTGAVPIPDGLPGGGNGPAATSTIVVTGVAGSDKIRVSAEIDHSWDGDLQAELVGPDGTTVVLLFDDVGGSGDNFGTDCPADGNDTVLDDDATTDIEDGVAPFVGTFIPMEPLSGLNSQDPNGTWTLRVFDDFAADTGTINCWTIEFLSVSCEDGGGVCAGSVPVFDFDSVTVTGGNGDDNIDANECLNLDVAITNNGTATATGIVGTLSTTTPGVTITQNTSAYPDAAPGATVSNTTLFGVQTSADFDCTAGPVNFELSLTKNEGGPHIIPFSVNPGVGLGTPVTFEYNGPQIPIPDNNVTGISSSINVSGVSGLVGKVKVALYATHTWNSDLVIKLRGPDGTTVTLSGNEGDNSDNFGVDCPADGGNDVQFDDDAGQSIVGYDPGDLNPIVGIFSPEEPLSAFNLTDPNGDWTLEIADVAAFDTGELFCWSVTIEPATCEDGGCVTSLYVNEFDTLPDWQFKGNWEITSGLVGGANFLSPTNNSKSTAKATDFGGCLDCTLTTVFRTEANGDYRVWVWFHYVNNKNRIQLEFKPGKTIFSQIVNGNLKNKQQSNFSLVPNQLYTVTIDWDGTQYTATVDGGGPTLSFVPQGTPASATFGVGAKRDAEFDRVQVD